VGTGLASPDDGTLAPAMLTLLHQPRLGFHVLRLSVAGLMLMHGIAKLLRGVGGIEQMLVAKGLPGWFAYGAYVGEVLAPLLVIAGFWVQPAALLMAVNMLFAIYLAHAHEIVALGRGGGWAIELQALFLFGSVSIALLARPGPRG
jgi:putative oxidoreductase